MTVINTVYTPVSWGKHEFLERRSSDNQELKNEQVQLCKATDVHYGRYTTYGSAIPEFKVDMKVHLGYVVMKVKDMYNDNDFTTRKQPIHDFKTKIMSDKLAREWNKWYLTNDNFLKAVLDAEQQKELIEGK